MKKPELRVELPATPDPPDLQPIHDRLQAAEQTISDLRERLARTEEQLREAIAHNPASEEALRLATDAHNLAVELQKSLRKIQKDADDPAKTLPEVPPPAPPQDPDPEPQPPQLPSQEHRKPFWHRLL